MYFCVCIYIYIYMYNIYVFVTANVVGLYPSIPHELGLKELEFTIFKGQFFSAFNDKTYVTL